MTVTTANMSTTAVMNGDTTNRNSMDNSPVIIATNTNTTTTKTTTSGATTARSSTPKKSLLPASIRTCPYCRHLGSTAHIARCAQKDVQCSFCGTLMPAAQIGAHTTYACEERLTIVACVGCGVEIPRMEMIEHLRTLCTGSQFRCEKCQQLFLTPAEYAMHATTIITGCPLAVKAQKEEEKEKEREEKEEKKKQHEQEQQSQKKPQPQKQPLKEQKPKQKTSESTQSNVYGTEHAVVKVKRRGTTASTTSIHTPKATYTNNIMETVVPSTPEARPCTEEVVDVQIQDSKNNVSLSKQKIDNSASRVQESHPCPILTEEDCLAKTVARISENRGGSPARHPSKFTQVKEKIPYNPAAAYKEMKLNGSSSVHKPMRERQAQCLEATHYSRERNRVNPMHSMWSMPVTNLHKQSRGLLKELQERREALQNSKQRYSNIVSAAAPRLATAELQAKRSQQQNQKQQQPEREEEGDLGLRNRTIRTSQGAAAKGLIPRYKSCPPDRRRYMTPFLGESQRKNHITQSTSDASANDCRVLLTVTPAQEERKAAEFERHNSAHHSSRQMLRKTSPFAAAAAVGAGGRRSGSCRRMPSESTN
ncbi:hypothetical protein LSM04_005174 [Trypanosoma melophagium]|uniref:uncharacterized protein n=1 Tax=Trypanosoma melophagium TaxID=715481 RepID=UPI003519DB24|nr:hypothetical protein LSM04_005174 [Trypanosoma melophagium]